MVEQCRTPGICDALSGMSWVFGWRVEGTCRNGVISIIDIMPNTPSWFWEQSGRPCVRGRIYLLLFFGRKTAHDSGFLLRMGGVRMFSFFVQI